MGVGPSSDVKHVPQSSLQEFWKRCSTVTAEDLVDTKKSIVTLNESNTVETAIKELSRHHISSAPVVNENGHVVGMLSNLDLIAYLSGIINPRERDGTMVASEWKSFLTTPVINVVEGLNIKPALVSKAAPLTDILTKFSLGAKRVIVHADNEDLLPAAIVSQIDVVRFFDRHEDYLGPLGSMTAEALHLGRSPAKSFYYGDTAISVLAQLHGNRITGAPLVDDGGVAVGCISSSDIKRLTPEEWGPEGLFLPVGRFVHNKLEHPPHQDPSLLPSGVFACDYVTTLREIVGLMTSNGVHRLFLMEAGPRCVVAAVVSTSDVISTLVNAVAGAGT